MNTTKLGRAAEDAVAKELKARGYEILDQNWRTRACEIDIVAKKDEVIYFAEVKYRTSAAQGTGLDYITGKKLAQLRFAAQLWSAENDWNGDSRILAAAVNSSELTPVVEQIVEI